MSDIKSAQEIAMEKIGKIGEATEEERLRWKYLPEGEKLAARYIHEELNLAAEMGKFDEKAKRYILKGADDILIRNITLPKNDTAKKNNKRAMDGLKSIKSNKTAAENVLSRIRQIFNHYTEQGERQRKQAYEALKGQMTAKMQQMVQQQMGSSMKMKVKIDVESQPQFHEEWRKVQAQLDSQYLKLLDEYKQELLKIS